MNYPKVIAAFLVSGHGGYQSFLVRDLERAGIPLIAEKSADFSWRKRILWSRDVAKAHPDDILVFLDAWDTILLGSKDEIIAMRLEEGVLFAAAKTCWPDEALKSEYGAKNPTETSPWRYLNSNPMAGLGSKIAKAIDWGWERFPLTTDETSIQASEVCETFYSRLYLDAPAEFGIRIDSKCELGQILYGSLDGELFFENYRVKNLIHETMPVFLHANNRQIIPEGLLRYERKD